MSTVLVAGVATLAVASAPLPSGNAPQASNSVVVTDAGGTVYPAVVLTGAEATPWSWAATYAQGQAAALVQALDTAGNPIGAAIALTFGVVAVAPPATFEQAQSISFVASATSASVAAKAAALKK